MSVTYAPRISEIFGCTDPAALNYDALATMDDGSCTFSQVPVSGCMDSDATNYNPLATLDDGSCVYAGAILGCTDPDANNYNASATQDDGSCTYDAEPSPNYLDIICATYTENTVEYVTGVFMKTFEQTCNTNTNKPVLISLHAGGTVYTDNQPCKYAKDFASRGYLGISANYNYDGVAGSFTTAKQKSAIAHVCALIRHLRANAVAYGINPDNIFTIGISAGALTSLGVNAACNDIDNGVAYWDDPVNATNASESSVPTATATQSGAIINGMQVYFNSGGVPNYFYHGTLDTTMNYAQAISNYNTQIALGIASTFVPYPSEGHSIGNLHHEDILTGGSLMLDGVTTDIGIVQRFKNLLT